MCWENVCCATRLERVRVETDQNVCGIAASVCIILPYTFMIYMTNVYTAVRWNNDDVTGACMRSQRALEAEETVYGTCKMYAVSDCANSNGSHNLSHVKRCMQRSIYRYMYIIYRTWCSDVCDTVCLIICSHEWWKSRMWSRTGTDHMRPGFGGFRMFLSTRIQVPGTGNTGKQVPGGAIECG